MTPNFIDHMLRRVSPLGQLSLFLLPKTNPYLGPVCEGQVTP